MRSKLNSKFEVSKSTIISRIFLIYFYRFDIISVGATKEEQLRKTLVKMKEDWKHIILSTSPYYKYDLLYPNLLLH